MSEEGVERKLTTILAADVVGYSRLMGDDEAGTVAVLKACRRELLDPKSAQYHGRTVKLMGDGTLMEFGSVVEAVQFAVEVQCAMRDRNKNIPNDRQLVFRIGINIGDIIVDGDDIYGDGVNVAARLEGLSEPGGIHISRTVYNHVKGKLSLNFEDKGEQKVKNIANPVGVYDLVLDDMAAALVTSVTHREEAKRPSRRQYAIAAVLVAVLVGASLAWFRPWAPEFDPASVDRMALALPDKPSIVVLPFDNLGGDPEQDYFADGMTEDLITDLAKLSSIFVISRNSSWAYKDRTVEPQQVAEDLGVRYLVEGSVRRQGEELRVNAQLIDAIGGHHLWADRYDGAVDDVFAFQDQIVGEIVAALAVNLTSEEQVDLAQVETDNPQAYDALLQGLSHLRQDSEGGTQRAISLFEQAIVLDPQYSRAYAALASANWRIFLGYWFTTAGSIGSVPERVWRRMNENLARAMERPTSLAYSVSAELLAQQGRHDEAFGMINQAIALAPNNPDAYLSKATILNATGRAEEAEEAVRWAMRLDPQYAPRFLRELAMSLFNQERYEEAVEAMERVVSVQSDIPPDYATLASSFGHLGQLEKVPAMIEEYNALAEAVFSDPLTVQETGWWLYTDMFNYDDTYREQFQAGLRKGGVPEGAGTDLARDDYLRFMTQSEGEYSVEGAIKIDAAEARALVDRGDAVFVDVRAAAEFPLGHIPGAHNLSVATALSSESLSDIVGKDDNVVFYCHGKHCPYSAYASAKAVAWGFSRVHYFAGGFPAWQEAGYEIESTEGL